MITSAYRCQAQLPTIQGLEELFSKMENPIALTVRLRRSKTVKASEGRRQLVMLNESHLARIYDCLSKQFKKMQFLNSERKSIGRKTILVIGNFEEGLASDQPHIHLVVDFRHTVHRPLIKYCISAAISEVHRATGFISGSPHINFESKVDSGWVRYFSKGDLSNLLIG